MEEKRHKLLVVDDTPVNLTLIKSQMRGKPFDVQTAGSGEEALRKISEDCPDLVLLDVMMPGMDGMEVLSRIRMNAETENLPVVMLTALSDFAYQADAKMRGADGFLTKPLIMSQLMDMIKSILH